MAPTRVMSVSEQEDIHLHRVLRAEQQTSPPISAKKRQRSPCSLPETNSKRRALSADRFPPFKASILGSYTNKTPTPKPYKSDRSEDNWCCPNCGLHCWLCKLTPAAPPEQLELRDEEEIDQAKMTSEHPPSTTDTSSVVPSTKKRKKTHYAHLGMKFIGPKDQGFKDHILDPLGVFLVNRPQMYSKPPTFIGSQAMLQSRVVIGYNQKDLERITTEFKVYNTRPYDEHALSTLCWDSIMLRDAWVVNALANWEPFDYEEITIEEDQEPIMTSVRRDKWKPQKQGPPISNGGFVYDWDLEPDTTYAVSIRMFNLEYRKKLHLNDFQSWVAEKDVSVCPYLTVEYKCSGKGGKLNEATSQAIAAAILWLHQRKDLRNTIGKAFEGLCHFLITIVDSSYIISKARLGDNEYIISEQVNGDLTKIDDLKLYIEWSNAIHAWGLGANASAFKEDIEALVELENAQRPNHPPTPAGTVSPMGPPPPKPGQSV